jgi:hypothetical protein
MIALTFDLCASHSGAYLVRETELVGSVGVAVANKSVSPLYVARPDLIAWVVEDYLH